MRRTTATTWDVNRRHFLRGALAGGVALAAGPLLFRPGWGWAQADALGDLIVRSADPPNAEPALHDLVQSWQTPTKSLYVRSHGTTPKIDPASFRLEISGLVHHRLSLSLAELQERYRKATADATLLCAGNRRQEFNAIRPVGGVQWDAGAIGNANWGGVPLSELLRQAGLKEGAKHLWFEGLDEVQHDTEIIAFGGSIPVEKAMHDQGGGPGALAVYEMNGQPLTADHGFPLRTIVPGYIGARSVKWLGKIVVSDRPSSNHFLKDAYKLVTTDDPAAAAAASPIYEYPINSAICIPAPGAKVGKQFTVQGYAHASGKPGRSIARVELSTDGGGTWSEAKLLPPAKPFCWQLWQADVRLADGSQQLTVRATDSAGEMQPDRVDWNLKGYLYNAWHRLPIDA